MLKQNLQAILTSKGNSKNTKKLSNSSYFQDKSNNSSSLT